MKQKDRKQEMLDAYTLELIRQVESEGLRKAPAHMKAEILERSRKPDYQIPCRHAGCPETCSFSSTALR